MNALDSIFFVALPYTAMVVFLIGTIYKFNLTRFQYSSLSSQFLEGRKLFWGSVPFHWGMIFIFFGHLVAFLFPRTVLAWNGEPVRLIILEVTAFAFALCVVLGLCALIYRRVSNERLRMVTSYMDLIIEFLLLAQVILGIWIAYQFRWGSSWFAAVLSPYLWSIFSFAPDATAVAAMPLLIKAHIAGAFLIVLLFPFTRLVHMLVYPIRYIGRPFQKVIWNYERRRVRNPESGWTPHRPHNN